MRLDIIKNTENPASPIHVCQTTLDTTLPDWRKLPICKAGRFRLANWAKQSVDSTELYRERLCKKCLAMITAGDTDTCFTVFKNDIGMG